MSLPRSWERMVDARDQMGSCLRRGRRDLAFSVRDGWWGLEEGPFGGLCFSMMVELGAFGELREGLSFQD